MKAVAALAVVLAILLFLPGGTSRHDDFANDVSWPNCGPQAQPASATGIVGINGGKIYTLNPCFDKQAAWFKNMAVYLNTGYPGKSYAIKYAGYPRTCDLSDESCLAYNYGFNSVLYSIRYLSLRAVLPQRIWLDVETVNSWSDDVMLNRQAVSGMIDATNRYVAKGTAGIYSAPRQWRILTGNWQNGLPAWVATGSLERKDAAQACQKGSFSGGPLLMAQYTKQLDENVFCMPGSFQP